MPENKPKPEVETSIQEVTSGSKTFGKYTAYAWVK